MTHDPPQPMTPPDCDVRMLDGFMLNVERLLASELWAISSGDELKAALSLWCRAWKQVPAASLPNDERVLAAFSGAGAKWKKVRAVALRGFVLCSDGRLYHPVLSADAIRAAKARKQRQDAINKRYGKGRSEPEGAPPPNDDEPLGGGTGEPTAVATAEDTTVVRDRYQRRDGTGREERKIVDDGGGARARPQFDPATERVIEASGADPSKQARWMTANGHVSQWLQRGYDLELDVVPTVLAVMVSRRGRGPPDGPSYFDRAIQEAHEQRLRGLPDITIPSGDRTDGRSPRQRETDRRRAEQADAFRAASRGELGDVFG